MTPRGPNAAKDAILTIVALCLLPFPLYRAQASALLWRLWTMEDL